MSGNTIPSAQNSDSNLNYTAAASAFYGRGKVALGAQMSLTIGVVVVLSFVSVLWPSFKLAATFISVTIAWVDVLFIDRIQAHYRKLGAKAQESFDYALFGLPWNDLRVGERLEPEVVHRSASRFRLKSGDEKLRDWYPNSIADLPLPLARLVCQRACFWWDTTLRRIYGWSLVGIVTLALFGMTGFALYRSQSVGNLVLSVYAPFAPAVLWSIREARRQKEAADALEKGRSFVDKIWARAVNGELSEEELARWSRQIQDALFDGRSRNPLIFNWVHFLLRSGNEQAMRHGAAMIVEDALGKQSLWRGRFS